jgi:hypothetical protein
MTLNDDCIRRPHEGGGTADALLRSAERRTSHAPSPLQAVSGPGVFYIDMLG